MGVKVCLAQVSSFHFIRRRSQHERLARVATREEKGETRSLSLPQKDTQHGGQCVHTHSCAHIRAHTYTCTRVSTYTETHIHMHACIHVHVYANIHARTDRSTHDHVHIHARYACTCRLRTHAHRHRITFAHTHVPGPGERLLLWGSRRARRAEQRQLRSPGGAVKEALKAPEGGARHVGAEGHVLQGSVVCVSP